MEKYCLQNIVYLAKLMYVNKLAIFLAVISKKKQILSPL